MFRSSLLRTVSMYYYGSVFYFICVECNGFALILRPTYWAISRSNRPGCEVKSNDNPPNIRSRGYLFLFSSTVRKRSVSLVILLEPLPVRENSYSSVLQRDKGNIILIFYFRVDSTINFAFRVLLRPIERPLTINENRQIIC